jgi:hypothetical protein
MRFVNPRVDCFTEVGHPKKQHEKQRQNERELDQCCSFFFSETPCHLLATS